MEYRIENLSENTIFNGGLDKRQIGLEIEKLKVVMNKTPIQCPGVILAEYTGNKQWNYSHMLYIGKISPLPCQEVPFKNGHTASIVAVINEVINNGE